VESLDESLALLEDMGLSLPTPAYLVGLLLFGLAGIVFWVLGRRRRNPAAKWIGLALMLYPYLVWGTVALYGAGAVLCAAAVWCWRRDPWQRQARR
jgi:hypothetical protein